MTEPVAAPAWQETEARETTPDRVDVRTAFDAGETQAGHETATADAGASSVAPGSEATGCGRESAPRLDAQSAPQLSPESIDAIARRVVELLSDHAVREIAWEVVPDLAERLIRQKLEEERARAR